MFHSKTEGSGATKTKKEWYDIFGYFTQDGLKLLPTTSGWDGGVAEDKNAPGKLTAKDPKDIMVPAADFYRLRVTLNNGAVEGGTYQLVPSKWGVIGDATPGGWDADTDMTLKETGKGNYEWTVTLPLEGGKGFKFRENDGWDVNLGLEGSDSKLKQDGGNITVATSGSYTITLDLKPTGYTYSIRKN
jgi:starch-binding outer membrane protein SusE/F